MIKLFKRFFLAAVLKICPSIYKWIRFKRYKSFNWKTYTPDCPECELLLIKYFLKDKPVFFDIGANTGVYIYYAEKCIPGKNIYAFEPIPRLLKRLKKIFRQSNIFDFALSNNNENKKLKIPIINNSIFFSRATLNIDYKEEEESSCNIINVKTITLDDFVKKHNIRTIGLIKIDVEGHEENVINGGIKTITKFKPFLFIEIEQRHHTKNINKIIKSIKKMGYICTFFDIENGMLKELAINPGDLQNLKDFKINRNYVNNFIFLPIGSDSNLTIKAINSDFKQ